MSRRYGFWLSGLTFLFALRVFAQLLQKHFDWPFLPPFEAWHSAVLPYPALLAVQLVILAICMRTSAAFWNGRVRPSAARARFAARLGCLYFGAMLARLVLGLSVWSDRTWFSHYLPALFHLVLAGFVLMVARFHGKQTHQRQPALCVLVADRRGSGRHSRNAPSVATSEPSNR